MRIDVHAHYWTEDYLDLLADLGKADVGAARGLGAGAGADLDVRLRLMDRAEVPAPLRNRLPLRKRGHLPARRRLPQRPADRSRRRPGHPRP
jgi:hypothetical protein